MEKQLIPQLRFPEFKGNWITRSLGDVTKLLKDGTHGTHKEVSNSGIYLLSAKNIKNNSILITDNERKISEEDYNAIYKNYTLKENDILLTVVGTIGQLAKFKSNHKIAFQRSVAFFRFEKNPDFFLYQFTANIFQKELKKRQVVSAQPGIYLNDLSKIPINLTTIEEQQKIAAFLTDVDTKITQLTKKKSLLEQYKKGIMQKIFSQELRFRDDDGTKFPEWEEKQLRKVAIYRRGSFPQPYGLPKWYDNDEGFPFVQVYDVDDNMLLKPTTKNKISALGAKKSVFVPKGTLVITIQGSIGRIAVTQYDSYVDRTLLIFQSYKKPLNIDYFKYVLFLLFEIEKEKAPGGIIKTITKEVLSSFNVMIPCLEEQTKIANFLSDIDIKIEALQTKIENTKTFKKGLLQKMFV